MTSWNCIMCGQVNITSPDHICTDAQEPSTTIELTDEYDI